MRLTCGWLGRGLSFRSNGMPTMPSVIAERATRPKPCRARCKSALRCKLYRKFPCQRRQESTKYRIAVNMNIEKRAANVPDFADFDICICRRLRHDNGSDDHSADNRDKPEIDEQIVLEHAPGL